jgi:O-antigen ligase
VASRFKALLFSFLGVTLLLRVLTDDLSSPDSRHSGSLNLSGAIAVLFILVAAGLLLRQRRGMTPTIFAALWLCIWTAVAVGTRGASTETLREGVREGSVVALAVIVYNGHGAFTVSGVTRLVQLAGIAPAVAALYQLATHTGLDVAGHIRSNGTFAHPNSAAMFFTIAATASLWCYLDKGRYRADAALVIVFLAALIATFSIDGLLAMAATLIAFGWLRDAPLPAKLGPCGIAALVVLVFFATPLGSQRIVKESSTSLAATEHGEPNTTLSWRLHKWETLLPQWERSPLFGRGLGTTTTIEVATTDEFTDALPHNEYLRYLVETGVVGLVILLLATGTLVRAILRRRDGPGTSNGDFPNAAALAMGVIVGCLVDSLADNTFLNSPTCYAATLIVVAVLTLRAAEGHRAPTPQAA